MITNVSWVLFVQVLVFNGISKPSLVGMLVVKSESWDTNTCLNTTNKKMCVEWEGSQLAGRTWGNFRHDWRQQDLNNSINAQFLLISDLCFPPLSSSFLDHLSPRDGASRGSRCNMFHGTSIIPGCKKTILDTSKEGRYWPLNNNTISSYNINWKMHPKLRDIKMWVKIGHDRITKIW